MTSRQAFISSGAPGDTEPARWPGPAGVNDNQGLVAVLGPLCTVLPEKQPWPAALEFAAKGVADVEDPIGEMVLLPASATPSDIQRAAAEHGYSKYSSTSPRSKFWKWSPYELVGQCGFSVIDTHVRHLASERAQKTYWERANKYELVTHDFEPPSWEKVKSGSEMESRSDRLGQTGQRAHAGRTVPPNQRPWKCSLHVIAPQLLRSLVVISFLLCTRYSVYRPVVHEMAFWLSSPNVAGRRISCEADFQSLGETETGSHCARSPHLESDPMSALSSRSIYKQMLVSYRPLPVPRPGCGEPAKVTQSYWNLTSATGSN